MVSESDLQLQSGELDGLLLRARIAPSDDGLLHLDVQKLKMRISRNKSEGHT